MNNPEIPLTDDDIASLADAARRPVSRENMHIYSTATTLVVSTDLKTIITCYPTNPNFNTWQHRQNQYAARKERRNKRPYLPAEGGKKRSFNYMYITCDTFDDNLYDFDIFGDEYLSDETFDYVYPTDDDDFDEEHLSEDDISDDSHPLDHDISIEVPSSDDILSGDVPAADNNIPDGYRPPPSDNKPDEVPLSDDVLSGDVHIPATDNDITDNIDPSDNDIPNEVPPSNDVISNDTHLPPDENNLDKLLRPDLDQQSPPPRPPQFGTKKQARRSCRSVCSSIIGIGSLVISRVLSPYFIAVAIILISFLILYLCH